MALKAWHYSLAILALTLPLSTASADVIYRETFSNDSSATKSSYAGWKINFGANGGAVTDYQNVLTNSASATPSLAAVNSNPTTTATANGYIYNSFGGSWNAQTLYWTDELTISASTYTVDSISWYQVLEKSADATRVALRVGTQWYVSQQTFSGSAWSATFASAAQQKTLTLKDSLWLPLNFGGGTLGIGTGAAAALPTGNITAFGLFTDLKSGVQMFDTFEVQATPVPEPASLSLGVAGAALLLARRPK